jgi:hypothetical protein
MAGFTNKGKMRVLDIVFRAATPPTNFYLALVTSAVAPTADTNTFSELTEIPSGNGYTAGGYLLNRNSTDFDTLTEDDTGDEGVLLLKNIVWTASGGSLPGSGTGARWAVLTDDNATQASREIWLFFDLLANRIVTTGNPLTIQDAEISLTE